MDGGLVAVCRSGVFLKVSSYMRASFDDADQFSSARTKCDLSKSLGWKPTRGAEWNTAVEVDFGLVNGL